MTKNRPKGMPREEWRAQQLASLRAQGKMATPAYRRFQLLVLLYLFGTLASGAVFLLSEPPTSLLVIPTVGLLSGLLISLTSPTLRQPFLSGWAVSVLASLAAYPVVNWGADLGGSVDAQAMMSAWKPMLGQAVWIYVLYRALRMRWAWDLFGDEEPQSSVQQRNLAQTARREFPSAVLLYANVFLFAWMIHRFAARGFGDLPLMVGGMFAINLLVYRLLLRRPESATRYALMLSVTAALASVPAVEALRWFLNLEPVLVGGISGAIAGSLSFVLSLTIPALVIAYLLLASAAEANAGSTAFNDKRPAEFR